MPESWSLRRTRQCAHCPWRMATDPHDIPNGYTEEQHAALAATIAPQDMLEQLASLDEPLRVMACHERHEDHCVGWLVNQLGPGNNLALRLRMRTCTNGDRLRLRGAQHATFAETLPAQQEADNGHSHQPS